MKKISQREARRLQKELARLENRLERMYNAYAREWPGGVHIASSTLHSVTAAKIKTARRLGFAVVVTMSDNSDDVLFYATKG